MRRLLLGILITVSGCDCTNSVTVKNRDAGVDSGTGGGAGGSDSGSGGGGGSLGGGMGGGGGASCVDGEPCGDGGVCAGGSCCGSDSACGSACCGSGEVCSFQRCVQPGASCRETSDCLGTDFCDLSRVIPGQLDAGVCVVAPTMGQCVSEPPHCPPDAGSAAGRSCVEPCRFTRAGGQFRPVVKYAWGNPVAPYTSDVMMAPIVTQLDDDDCDGRVTSQDRPDIVVVTFEGGQYNDIGTTRALSVKDGTLQEKWAAPGVINAASQLASGNIDEVPGNEVVGCGATGPYALHGADGGTRWVANGNICRSISLADLEGDGHVEVITGSQIFEGRTGALIRTLPFTGDNTVADVDGNGQQDIVWAGGVSRPDGTVLASMTGLSGWVAIGDLNLDGRPEIVSVNSSTHALAVWSFDPSQPNNALMVRTGLDINQTLSPNLCPSGSAGNLGGGGPPTIGDFNLDGFPDVALAGGVGYAVFDGKKLMDGTPADQTLLWIRQTQDCSSAATGSTLFDFDGDGRVEAVYADEVNLHVYDSATGMERFTTCNTSGTLIEYPLVADVDNDGQADLVVVSNAYAFSCVGDPSTRHSGVRVFSSMDNDWVVTRRVWNQHAYSVTNVEEDGHIPRNPTRNWVTPGLNNFRQNKQPGLEFAAADAVVSMSGACEPAGVTYRVVVSNIGEASIPAGLRVEIVADPSTAPMVLTTLTTTRSLGPTQAERFVFVTTEDVASKPVVARILASGLRQCRTDNDTSDPPTVGCIN